MASSDDYKTVAAVLRHSNADDAQAAYYEQLAADAKARESYAESLGRMCGRRFRGNSLEAGTRIMIKILEDGWIPPEGLF